MSSGSILDDFLQHLCECAKACGLCLPECKIKTHGPPPLDCCDVLAVYRGESTSFDEGQSTKCFSSPTYTLNVELWGCLDNLVVVNGCEITTASACATSKQACCLAKFDKFLHKSGLEFFNDSYCTYINAVGQVTPLPPQGGCAGWRGTFQYEEC